MQGMYECREAVFLRGGERQICAGRLHDGVQDPVDACMSAGKV